MLYVEKLALPLQKWWELKFFPYFSKCQLKHHTQCINGTTNRTYIRDWKLIIIFLKYQKINAYENTLKIWNSSWYMRIYFFGVYDLKIKQLWCVLTEGPFTYLGNIIDFSCERPKKSEKIEWDREYPPSITNGLLALVFLSQKAFSLLIIVLFFCSKSFFHQRSLISLSDLIQLNFLLACLTKSICLPYHLHKSWLWLNFVWIVW